MTLLALLALACTAPSDRADDTGAVDTDDGAYTLVVATVASDYSTGQVATLDVTTGVVADALFPTTSDPIVEVDGGRVFLLDRSAENTVRMYEPGDWSAPLVEFSTGDGSNPQDVALCGDVLVVTMLAADHLGLWDATTGLARGTIDLSAWDDGDGTPEADGITTGPDGALYVTLNQYDTSVTPWSSASGTGTILKIGCDTLQVAESWTVGPNPGLSAHPLDPTKLLLRTGDYYDPDYSAKLDGALATFDPATGDVSAPHMTEEAFGYNLSSVVGNVDGKAILVADDAYSWGVWCLDLATWTATATPAADSFIGDAVATPDGKVWVGYRPGYAGNGDPVVEGLVAWDPATCTAAAPVATVFPPYSVGLSP